MSVYKNNLPQLSDKIFLTDGGIETSLIFLQGFDLPHFASFTLLNDEQGCAALKDYFRSYARIAKEAGFGFVLETPTWRASQDWGDKLGYSKEAMIDVNLEAIRMMESLRSEFEGPDQPFVISGNVGPRGDGYRVDAQMSVNEARDYHSVQISTFAKSAADCVTAATINYVEEAIGIALAARDHNMPVIISFTVETDGRLPSGLDLDDAITTVDIATGGYVQYYMVNCAHPSHFEANLESMENIERLKGVRANASRCSHAELDEAEELDDGNPFEFGMDYQRLRERFPSLTVFGGCCGTDHRHIEEASFQLRAQVPA